MDGVDFSEDTRPDFYLYFAQQGPAVSLSEAIFRNHGIDVKCASNGRLLLLALRDELIFNEAEARELRKPRADSGDCAEFSARESDQFASNEQGRIFDDNERSFLAERILRSVRVDSRFLSEFPHARAEESLIHACIRLDLVTGFDPLHHPHQRLQLWKDKAFTTMAPSARNLRNYFGESVAFYFEWMKFYTKSLVFLGVPGGLLWLISLIVGHTSVDRNPYVPFYTIIVIMWGFLFVKLWQRRSNDLAFKWGTYDLPQSYEFLPDFHGEWRVSVITGQPELYYPAWKRRIRYLISALVTFVMLCIAFFTMICSLNLQGYVHEYTRFGDDNPFHVPFLNEYALPGHLFDPNGPIYFSLIPVLLHSTVIFILNQMIYRRIAEYLTESENHKTRSDFNRSLIIKRFFFDAFDSYIALFYLAFYEVDVDALRVAVIGLYMTDSIRRIVLESIVPLCLFNARYGVDKVRARSDKKSGDQSGTLFFKEIYADEYEEFDDYLEMVIQHGYIVLFASACPLASLLSIFTNIIEIKADLFKLLFVTKRPRVQRCSNIGIWQQIVATQTWLAIITNVFIFGFSSEQMMQWFPWFFNYIRVFDQTGHIRLEQELQVGAGRYVLGFIFFLEHLFILVGLLLHFSIANTTLATRNAILAVEYRKNQAYMTSIAGTDETDKKIK